MALTGTKGLLIWCQRSTEGYNDVKVVNMTTSFRDGLAFCAIIHHFRPDLINFDSLAKENVWENNQLAFEVAEKELNIPSLLDPDDMVALPVPDKLSIMTYVSQYYNYFKNKKGAVELGIKTTAGVGRTTVKRPRDDPNPFKKEGVAPAKKAFPANTCQVCGKKVYLVEKVVSNNKLYHRSCFKCNKCGGTLRPGAAKVGNDPSQIECQHHQDKIWSLRTNMANRIKQKEKGKEKEGLESIWESKSGDSPPTSTPIKITPSYTKNASAKPLNGDKSKPAVIRHPQQTPPPIPTNPPSKDLHPHLSSQSSARAQFFSPTPEKPAPQTRLETKEEKDQRLKAGLITTLAGVMSKEEEKRKKPKETSLDEPTKLSPTSNTIGQKTDLVKPPLPNSKPKAIEEKSPTPSLISQRTAMFSQNKDQKEVKIKEPAKVDAKDEAKKVEKQEDKSREKELKKPEAKEDNTEDKTAAAKPIVGGSGGVKAMISKMEQESASDDQVSGEGMGEVMEGVEEEGASTEDKTLDSGDEKQNTETLEKDKTAADVEGDAALQNGTAEEEFEESNPFFGSDDEEETIGNQNIENEKIEMRRDSGDIGKLNKSGATGSEVGADDSVIVENNDKKELEEGSRDGESLPVKPSESEDHIGSEKGSAIEGKASGKEDKIEDKKSEKSKDSDYDESLNPFGSDDDDDETSSDDSDSDLGPNNPFANSESGEEDEEYDESLNPFADDDDNVEEIADDPRVNPFTGSPIEDSSFEYSSTKPKPPRPPPPKTTIAKKTVPSFKTRQDVLAEMKQARNTLKQKKQAPGVPPPPPPGTPGSMGHPPRAKSQKSRRAPLPPGMTNGTVQHSGGEGSPTPSTKGLSGTPDTSPVPSPRTPNSQKVHRPGFKPPPQPQWKTSAKRRAPAPPPQKRNVRKHHVTPAEIQHEIAEIEVKTEELEKKGIELEDRLRAEMKDDSPEESEELLMEWFEVVNNKNQLVRREGELVAQAQIQELEIQHAEVEYDMRVLMHKQEHQKTDEDIKKEEELLELLVALVQQRSTIVDRLEEDRIREQEEDETIRNMMQMKDKLLKKPRKLERRMSLVSRKLLVPDQGLDRESVEQKKEKKKKKKKKHKDKTKDKEKKKKEKKKDKDNEP